MVYQQYGFQVNYKLVDEGIYVSDDFLSVVFDGSFEQIGTHHSIAPKQFDAIPYFKSGGRDLQMFFSEQTVNSIMRTVIMGNFKKPEKILTSDEITSIIEDFEDVFGDEGDVRVYLQPTPIENLKPEDYPKVILKKDDQQYVFRGEVHIMNPFDPSVDAMVLECQFKADLSFGISQDYRLLIDIDKIWAEIYEIKAYFKTSANKKKLTFALNFVVPFLQSYLNKQFDHGLKLPISKNMTKCIKEPRITTYDKYILVEAQPDFQRCDFRFYKEGTGERSPLVQSTMGTEQFLDSPEIEYVQLPNMKGKQEAKPLGNVFNQAN